jgi:hypothetical protein
MPFRYASYTSGSSSVALTTRAGRHDIGSDAARTPVAPLSTGGDFDELGSDRAPRSSQTVRIDETFVGTGRNAAIKAWKALHRTKGRLYRTDETTGVSQWTAARLQAIPIDRGVENDQFQAISLSFLLPNPIWYGVRHVSEGLTWGGGTLWDSSHVWGEVSGSRFALVAGANSLAVTNAGDQQVDTAIVTIIAGSAAVTAVRIQNTTVGIDWSWTGTLAATKHLVIDTGQQRITNDGTGAYSGYSRAAGHTVDTPIALPLPSGTTTFTLTLTGGGTGPLCILDFSDGYNA